MANITADTLIRAQGAEGRKRHLPVAATEEVFKGGLAAQLTATGGVCPLSTASSGPCIGMIQHGTNNTSTIGVKRVEVEDARIYELDNDTSDPFSDVSLVGAIAYAIDDHTVTDTQSGTLAIAGTFVGLEASGKVAVYVDAQVNAEIAARIAADAALQAAIDLL